MVARAQKTEVNKYFREYSNTRESLENKLGQEFIKKADNLLLEFEKLCYREWDLEEQTKEKSLTIENKKLLEKTIQNMKEKLRLKNTEIAELGELIERVKRLHIEQAQILHQPFGIPGSSKPY